jgi:hypothetical protein
MQVFNDIDPIELAGFLRGLTYNYRGPGTLEQFLPEVRREAMELTFPKGTRVVAEVGRYRTYDTEAPISGRPGFSRVTYEVPPLAEKMILTEEDRLRLEMARFFNGQGLPQELIDQIFDDAAILAKKILARWEYARGQVLQTAKVTAVSTETARGVVGDIIDYTSLGTIGTATASPLWGDTVNATPLADIRSWMNTYRLANDNEMPIVGLCSQAVLDALALTDDVKNALLPIGQVAPSIAVTQGNVQQLLGSFGLPPLALYNTVVNVAGASTNVLSDKKIIFLPAPDTAAFGETMIGLTSEGLDLAKQFAQPLSVGVGMTGLSYKEFDPPHIWTKVAAMGAPVLKDPAKVFVATVLA